MKIKQYKGYTHKDRGKQKEIKGIKLIEERKITVLTKTSKDKTKKYYSYQLSIPLDFIKPLLNIDDPDDNDDFCFVEHHSQYYELKISKKSSNKINDCAFKIKRAPLNDKNKTMQFTLPKRHITYLQAYDEYLRAIEIVNSENNNFEINPLQAIIELNIIPNTSYDLKYKVDINIFANIEKEFISYINKQYELCPKWIKTLNSNEQTGIKEIADKIKL